MLTLHWQIPRSTEASRYGSIISKTGFDIKSVTPHPTTLGRPTGLEAQSLLVVDMFGRTYMPLLASIILLLWAAMIV